MSYSRQALERARTELLEDIQSTRSSIARLKAEIERMEAGIVAAGVQLDDLGEALKLIPA